MSSDCYPTTAKPETSGAGASAGWGVITTHPQAERWATANLARWGYRTYLPLCFVTRRDPVLRTLTRRIQVPLFPGYAFVWITTAEPWGCIRSAPGVKSLLMAAGKPGYAPDAEILRLQAGEEARRSVDAGHPVWAPGAASTQAYGPFQKLPSVVHAIRGDKAIIGLMMLGQLREVVVPLDCLAPRDD